MSDTISLATCLVLLMLLVPAPPVRAQPVVPDATVAGSRGRPSGQQPTAPSSPKAVEGEIKPSPAPWMKGRVLIGAALRFNGTPDADLGSTWRPSGVLGYRPGPGWGPAFSFSWFRSDIVVPVNGVPTVVGSVRVRPVMVGIGYGVRTGKLLTTFRATVGYAFNKAEGKEHVAPDTSVDLKIARAWAAHPGVNVIYPLTQRLALVGSAGYVLTKPSITVDIAEPGRDARRLTGRWRAQYVTLGAGAAISIF